MSTLKATLNAANPNTLPDAARTARLGSLLAQVPRFLDSVVASDTIILPADAKASQILTAFSSVGTLTGGLDPVGVGATPATGEVAISLSGDIVFAAANAVTQAEVSYVTNEGEVTSELLTVAASAGLFASGRKSVELLTAVVTSGVTVGQSLTVVDRGATPASGEVALDVTGLGVTVNAANIVAGSLQVTYKATPGQGTATAPLGQSLDADADNLIP